MNSNQLLLHTRERNSLPPLEPVLFAILVWVEGTGDVWRLDVMLNLIHSLLLGSDVSAGGDVRANRPVIVANLNH